MKLRALEISEVNSYIKRVLTNDAILYNLKVKGEISNFKVHGSGNVYLSLKDEKSKINCVIFKSNYNMDLLVDNGSKVIAHGYISLYERDGSYQLYINDIEIEGLGDLYIEFNKLKEQLSKEGLFDVVKSQGFTCIGGVAAIAEHSIMHQFASGRPDMDDMNQLKRFAKEVKEKIDASILTEVQVKGNHPYKELKEVPFHPTASDLCTMCGLCAKLCPVHAIPFDAPNQTKEEQCISCMRCIQVCPSKARHLNEQMLSAVSEKMKPLFAKRKENELFL